MCLLGSSTPQNAGPGSVLRRRHMLTCMADQNRWLSVFLASRDVLIDEILYAVKRLYRSNTPLSIRRQFALAEYVVVKEREVGSVGICTHSAIVLPTYHIDPPQINLVHHHPSHHSNAGEGSNNQDPVFKYPRWHIEFIRLYKSLSFFINSLP